MTTQEVVPVGRRTLDELAQSINEGHARTLGHVRNSLLAALEVGQALIEARDHFAARQPFLKWMNDNVTVARTTADHYVRLAYYRNHLPPDLSGTETITAALEYVRGLPPVGFTGGRGADRRLNYEEARRLVASGVPQKEAAQMLGVAPPTLRRALLSDSERKKFDDRVQRIRKQRKLAFDREQANKTARRAGGPLAETYSLIRKALDAAQTAHDESRGPQRQAIASAMTDLHHAEDHITAALRNV